ncbi:MAG TPA: TetR/AcrR family transcriptional regulator [Longimicrobiales bacterium]|nr:TetR/AcrR family transcriptional regulator [Longimicrobiales bacterium]
MGSKERREREREDTRERIVAAARELFVHQGVEAVTMREIARRIDYTPTAIYHHFADKNALITELCDRDFLALARVFVRLSRIEDPIERLREIGLAYVDFALENPSQYRFMFMTAKPALELQDFSLRHGNPDEDAYAFLRQTIAEGMAAGRFRPEFQDVEQLAQMMWAGAHGVVSLYIVKVDDPWVTWRDPRETARVLMEATMRGALRAP